MSKLADLLQPTLPEGLAVPEVLDRAWSWMEAQGWGTDTPNGYFLTPYAGSRQLGVVFSAQESLAGWIEPGDPGSEQLVPIAQISGDGSTGVIWLDDEAVEAHAAFRSWVQTELGATVPDTWTATDPDPFEAWVGRTQDDR